MTMPVSTRTIADGKAGVKQQAPGRIPLVLALAGLARQAGKARQPHHGNAEEEQEDQRGEHRRHDADDHGRAGKRRDSGGAIAPAEPGDGDRQAGEREQRKGERGPADRRQKQKRGRKPGGNPDEDRLHHRCPAFRSG